MTRESIEDGFEDFLRSRTDQFRMHPSESVWTGLSGRIQKPRKWPLVLGGVFLFGLGIGAGVLLERSSTPKLANSDILPIENNLEQRTSASLSSPAQSIDLVDPINEQTRKVKNFLMSGQFQNTAFQKTTGISNAKLTPGRAVIDPFVRTAGIVPDEAGKSIDDIDATLNHFTAGRSRTLAMANKPASQRKSDKDRALKPSSSSMISANILNTIGRISRRTGLQLYIAPSVSYRRLVGQASKTSYSYAGFPYSANYGFPSDVNNAVVHKPAFGLEIGSALTQNIGRKLRLKAGLQFNFNNYDIEAYTYMPELAPMSAARTSGFGSSINALSYYRNSNGFDRTWLRNSHMMVSVPVGFEASLFGNRRVRFNVASTIQPTYVLNNKSYMISTNLKNYAQEPALYRNWNLNAGAEAYLSVDAGTYRWVMGPQMRYQLLSSYKEDYPIREHLVDYGFKIGIQKTLK